MYNDKLYGSGFKKDYMSSVKILKVDSILKLVLKHVDINFAKIVKKHLHKQYVLKHGFINI